MPRPPSFDGLDEFKFIVNYFLAGCEPPFDLVVDFSQEPLKDLLCLILLPDTEDIAQSIFEPKKGRKRKSGRHGRKRKWRTGIPDTSDLIGQKVRGVVNPDDIFNFSPIRKAFRFWNLMEGVNYSAALLDGITDVGYETLWGICEFSRTHCYEFPRMSRSKETPQFAGGVGPIPLPISAPIIDFSNGFTSANSVCRCPTQPYSVAVNMTMRNNSETDDQEMTAALGVVGGGLKAESYRATIGPMSEVTLSVSADFEPHQTAEWGLGSRSGFVSVTECNVLAYGQSDFPLPW